MLPSFADSKKNQILLAILIYPYLIGMQYNFKVAPNVFKWSQVINKSIDQFSTGSRNREEYIFY